MINWKHLATTPGYMSLKAVYIHDVQGAARQRNPMRQKEEFLRKFQWVINRAKHYAHCTGKSIEIILNEWEEKRDYWWLNYYQDGRQPKFHSSSMRPLGIRGTRKYYKTAYSHDPERGSTRIREFIAKVKPKKTKPRWNAVRKKRGF